MKSERLLIFAAALLSMLLFASCDSGGGGGEYNYFSGFNGVDMEFVSGNPPSVLYYDTSTIGHRDNSFDIILQLQNKGASDAFGAIYITGYDRRLVDIAGEHNRGNNFGALNIRVDSDGLHIDLSGFFSGRFGSLTVGSGGGIGWTTPLGDNYGNSQRRGPILHDWNLFVGVDSLAYLFVRDFLGPQFSAMFSALSVRSIFLLNGNNRDYPGGESEILYFPGFVYDMPEGIEKYDADFLVKMCYGYVTRAAPVVCIDPMPQSNVEKVCTPHTVTLGGGQGGPVAVTRVEQVTSPSKVVFTIHVEHKGDGTLYDYRSFYKCNPESGDNIRPTDLDVVYINDIRLSGDTSEDQGNFFRCKPDSGAIRLINGKGYIHCEYTPPADYLSSKSAYRVPLYIELWYFYGESMTKTMSIKKI